MISAIKKEIFERRHDFSSMQFDTLYFGGGTPSILSPDELKGLIELIQANYKIKSGAEITLEANPDDLSQEYLSSLRKNTIINRLSVGIQSFNDDILKFLNRRHNSDTAYKSIIQAKKEGFNNLSIDLIYGIPGMDEEMWQQNLETFRTLEIPHLSAYHLGIEPKTVFAYQLKKGKIKAIDEEQSLKQFKMLMQFARENNFEHYETSNFAKPGWQSKHNLGYWNREPYIGIGPSAHSFNQKQRRWNIANNTKYCRSVLENSNDYYEHEEIDKNTAYNEYLMTSLRMSRGIDANYLKDYFEPDYLSAFEKSIQKFIKQGAVIKEGKKYFLSDEGKFISDFIISELMLV